MAKRKKPLRRESRERARERREAEASRGQFLYDMEYRCAACRSKRDPLQVHKIARGAARRKASQDRRAWLGLCRNCHGYFDDILLWPLARQLAVKFVRDPFYFDPKFICGLRHRAVTDVTLPEIAAYLELKP